jgi:hypothetical protein
MFDMRQAPCYTLSGERRESRGGMAERLMAMVLKTIVAATSPGVRIPLPPPATHEGRSHSLVECARLLSG